MRIAICDDKVRGRERIRTLLGREFSQAQTSEFDSWMKLLESLEEGYEPDIAVLPVTVKGNQGIRGPGDRNKIYVMTPADEANLTDVLHRSMQEMERKRAAGGFLIAKVSGTHRKIPIDDILYVENNGRKVILHTVTETLEYYEKMSHLEEVLGEGFYRCHRGYLVAFCAINGYDNTSITISNGDRIYLAKQKYGDFAKKYNAFLENSRLVC